MWLVRVACVVAFSSPLLLTQPVIGGGQAKGKNLTVEMSEFKFTPQDITVEVGDTITWVNKGRDAHTATADKKDDPNSFDTKAVRSGQSSAAIAFKQAGKVGYHCNFHPGQMKGTITVKAKQ
jgi:plastocyanin